MPGTVWLQNTVFLLKQRAYLVDVRLQHATKLLEESDCKVKELCNLTGFYDEFQFMKTFKAKYGMTVKEYHKRHKL